MSELPKGWVTSTLADISSGISYGFTTKSNFFGDGARLLRITDIQDYHVVWDSLPFCDDQPDDSFLVKSGDIVVARTGATTGKSYLIKNVPNPTAFASYLIRIATNPAVSSDYVWKFMQGPDYWRQIQVVSKGTAQPGANAAILGQVRFPLAPLVEQTRIVAKLDMLSAKAARARAELARIEALVSRYKQAVLRSSMLGRSTAGWRDKRPKLEAASDLIGRISAPPKSRGGRDATDRIMEGKAALSVNRPNRSAPPKWQWVLLSRIARQETGHTPSRSHPEWWGGDIAWIGIKDAGLHHGAIIEDTLQKTNEAGLANSAARLLPKGTVCLSRTASVGYVTIMGKPMATSQDFVTWTCTEALVPKFLMYALMAEGEDIRNFGNGTTHTTIYFPEVRAMHICLAPLEEQHEIVRRIESAFARIDRLAAEAKRALDLLGKLDEAILAQAFRGELVPQDKTDEPASVLLDRIRAERASAPKAKRRGRAAAARS